MSNPEFAIAEVFPGKLNALVKNIMKQTRVDDPNEAVRLVNSGEWVISKMVRIWREENGVVYFNEPFVSDGTTGQAWVDRLIKKGRRVSDNAKKRLLLPDFKPTNGVITKIAVLKGELFSDEDRITKNIRTKAHAGSFTNGKKLFDPNPEIACMIRERCSDEEIEAMGLWGIIGMHKPIKDSDGGLDLLGAFRGGDGSWLYTYYGKPDYRWNRDHGFAFAVAQVGPQN